MNNIREDQGVLNMLEIEKELANTWFSYRKQSRGRLYFRIVNPLVSIEFDEISGQYTEAEHIHAIVRSPDGRDYGQKLLAEHLHSEH